MRTRLLTRACVGMVLVGAARAATGMFDVALRPELLDARGSRCVVAGQSLPVPDAVLAALAGPSESRAAAEQWNAGLREVRRVLAGREYHVVVAFKQPVSFGSAWVAAPRFAVLRDDAPYPGVATNEAHWVTVPVPLRQAQGLQLAIPDQPVTARAVRISATAPQQGDVPLPWIRFASKRLFNATPLAVANAESEYTLRPDMGPPRTFAAADLTRGGLWQNAGPDKSEKRVLRPPVSDVHPSWLVLSWPTPQRVSGLVLRSNITRYRLYAFQGETAVNPAIAGDAEWRLLRCEEVATAPGTREIDFAPETTRGLRLLVLATDEEAICKVQGAAAIVDLGEQPLPQPSEAELPPYAVTYALPTNAIVTVAINDAKGRRVRNLLARRTRATGTQAEPWDLKDEEGRYVAPGSYQAVVLHHPGLELRYEMTPYPNVMMHAPTNAPWETGHSGTGGWLADHSAPMALCAAGDRIYVGSPCAEDGLALFEADLAGRKLWSHHNFMAWTGPQRLCSNGREVIVHAATADQDHLWAVDIATKTVRTLWEPIATTTRLRGGRGMDVRGDTLYLAVGGVARWLTNAFGAADVDSDNCQPTVARKTARDDRGDPDPREDFLRAFRLTGTPPGQRGTLTHLVSTRGPNRQQHIVLACKSPVPIGTLVFPMPADPGVSVRFSVLKPDAPYPPNPERAADWLRLDSRDLNGWCALPAPPNTRTRALRITFVKGEDDELADLMADAEPESGPAWEGRIEGMKILRRRYRNVATNATLRVSSGQVGKDGVWDARRQQPLSLEDPAVLVMEWAGEQRIRGLAVRELDGQEMLIDAFTGPAGAAVDMADARQWRQVGRYVQARRYYYQPDANHNSLALYMDGYVDFGESVSTRALRLRVVSQYTARADGRAGLYGVRADRGAMQLDATRCRLYGVAALEYLGGEEPTDARAAERIEAIDLRTKRVVEEVHVPRPGPIAFNSRGELFAISEGKLCRVDWPSGTRTPFPADVIEPGAFAFDRRDNLYVFDGAADRRNVRVYDSEGTLVRTIGAPGGFQAGAWDPTRIGRVAAMAVDRRDQLWAVESQFHPQRLTCWSADGEFVGEHFGRTQYGGGGVLDPEDKSLLYYGPLEFKLDWTSGATRLQSLTWIGKTEAGEQPIYVQGRKYLVTRGSFFAQSCGIVYLYEGGKARLVAAVGLADKFGPLQTPEIRASLGRTGLGTLQFMWSDGNGDQQAQAGEVVFEPRAISQVQVFDSQLGIMADSVRFQVREFRADGVPVYEHVKLPLPEGKLYRLDNGTYFRMGGSRNANLECWTEAGQRLWSYPSEGNGVHAYYRARPLSPEQVVANFTIMGHGTAHAGDLGEFVVINGNSGIWHLVTADGLLAGNIFVDLRDRLARRWSFPRPQRGLLVENVTAGQEHFWGHVTRTADDRYHGIYRSTSVFEIGGMDRFKRIMRPVTVSAEDVQKMSAWESEHQRLQVYREAKLYACDRLPSAISVDGQTADWEGVTPVHLLPGESEGFNATLRAGHFGDELFLCYETQGMGPLRNAGEDFRNLFKSGGCVDLMLATDPAADDARKGPVAGDLRLLFSVMGGKPAAVLFEAVKPAAPQSERMTYATLVFKTSFDSVRLLAGARLAHRETERGYVLEAAIPMADLGLKPEGKLLKMDWGVIRTDETGSDVLGREYWSNKATTILSDIAAEAMLEPRLWGHIRFRGERKTLVDKSLDRALQGTPKDAIIDEMMEELGP